MNDIPIEIIELTTLIAKKPELLKDLHIHQSRLVRLAEHLISNGITVQKWIPVSERLPEDGKDVLAWKSGYVVHIAWYFQNFNEWCSEEYTYDDGEPTHWMPLPEPPKECE